MFPKLHSRWLRTRRGLVVVLAGLLLAASSCSDSGGGENFLLVVTGRATVANDTLVVLTRSVDWFTDEPQHQAGSVPLSSLDSSFDFEASGDRAPNAAVVGPDIDATVEITSAQRVDGGVRISYDLIRGELPDGEIGEIDLFVDDLPDATKDAVKGSASDTTSDPAAGIEFCKQVSTPNDDLIECRLAGGVGEIDLSSVVAEANAVSTQGSVTDSTTMWIQAWGGFGAPNIVEGGSKPGFAQMVTSAATLGSEKLYYWVAAAAIQDRAGGASTIVATSTPSDGNYLTTTNGLVLVAGGGGSAAESSVQGGNGGVAVSTTEADGSGGGTDGDGAGGGGGNADGNGAGGAGGSSDDNGSPGASGIGGTGGRSASDGSATTYWLSPSPVLDPTSSGAGGEGADGASSDGAGGGGGYGGGGGGGGTDFDPFSGNTVGGGGGGGSWALKSTVCDRFSPTPANPPRSPNPPTDQGNEGAFGVVRIIFNLEPAPC